MATTRTRASRRGKDAGKGTENAARVSAPRAAARQLRERILGVPEGSLLGSEEELMTGLGVSRDTLRQAVRLLENDGLVTIRRGVGGGFFAARPDMELALRASALYLRVHNVGLLDVIDATRSLLIDSCRLAAQSTDEVQRKQLQVLLARFAGDSDWNLADEIEFINAALKLAANPVLALFLGTVNRYAIREASTELATNPQMRELRRADILRLGEAILRREPEVAALLCARQLEEVKPWLEQAFSVADRGIQVSDSPPQTGGGLAA